MVPRVLGVDVGKTNLGLCLLQNSRVLDWQVCSLKGSQAPQVLESLSAIPVFEQADICVIEKQPPKNPTMTRIQHYLEMYCALRGVPAKVQDARMKLAGVYDKDLSTYTKRKKAAVEKVREFLQASEQEARFKELFAAQKKKDDLADAFLHALRYADTLEKPSTGEKKTDEPRIRAQKPKAGCCAYSKANVKWLLQKQMALDDPRLDVAIEKHFGSLGQCVAQLRLPAKLLAKKNQMARKAVNNQTKSTAVASVPTARPSTQGNSIG